MVNNPNIRFAGFSDEWVQRKLGEISRMYQPPTITGNDLLPDGVPVFGANGFIGFFSEANHIEDQVTISARGEGTGTPSYVHGPVWITGNSMVVNVDDFDINKYFLFANLTSNSLKKYVTGGAQPQITRDVLVKVPITLPNADEQQKIGSVFSTLDHKIGLEERQIKLLKDLKKGYLQKMFPKNGATVPEVRFKGFTDAWEERKLAEFSTSFSGGTPSAGNSSYYKGDIPFIRSGEINSDKTELFLTEDGLKNSSAKMVSVGDILYALYGATSGEVGISQINGAINQAILAIRPIGGYSSHFIMQWLRLQKQKIIDKYLQGGQGNLSGSIVKNLILNVPNFEEQQKIGAFFKQLDNTIALHQRKLDLLKDLKKGLLQQMFV